MHLLLSSGTRVSTSGNKNTFQFVGGAFSGGWDGVKRSSAQLRLPVVTLFTLEPGGSPMELLVNFVYTVASVLYTALFVNGS
ncbi:hypothetical protein C5613_34170 [Rhodococcus opacus]|uniref:Uncharacterized protein n=1 Tax=Rhodococcus opacus TaxID=37919 RepID=A0A2S8IRZ6_RHOOP|nr:hypothetical protein C5613_34170 [Rhodococcus opacus]